MHPGNVGVSKTKAGEGLAPFVAKMYQIVNDPSLNEIIGWGPQNNSVVIFDPPRFEKEILPVFFKHSNLNSFIRQLNIYGFRKLTSTFDFSLMTSSLTSQASRKADEKEVKLAFFHPKFQKGEIQQLSEIVRKKPSKKDLSIEEHFELMRTNDIPSPFYTAPSLSVPQATSSVALGSGSPPTPNPLPCATAISNPTPPASCTQPASIVPPSNTPSTSTNSIPTNSPPASTKSSLFDFFFGNKGRP
eukprot:TRINITY_DN3631_c0_g1_i1.p1 TRINITY_DN3631_c0_g1~~TRINITY_DN3631_c0_g1_i1.p1  ORF type:complete len:260 (-),score=77.26 TRINITY_DN3631_c0_g1_i1:1295-2029(-)